jgi:AcrR family transcriptional regulator
MTHAPPTGPRTTRRRQETRQRLITAAHEVFSERGIRDSPVEAICERAGYTRGAFYSNFATKEELFLALFREENDARVARIRAALADAGHHTATGTEPLHTLLSDVARRFMEPYAIDRNWYLLTSEFHAQALRQPELLPRVQDAQQRFHRELAELLVAALDRFGMRLTIDPIEAAHVLSTLYENALHRSLLGETAETVSAYATRILPQVIASLAAPAAPDTQPEPH